MLSVKSLKCGCATPECPATQRGLSIQGFTGGELFRLTFTAVKVDLLLLLWRSRVEWDVGNFAGRRLRRDEAEATARHYNGKMEAAVDDDDVEAEETDGQTDGC